jgi:hypothetical protein
MGRPAPLRTARAVFWDGIRSGLRLREAAEAAGVDRYRAEAWFREAGGVAGNGAVRGRGRYLSLAEREEIAVGVAAGAGIGARRWARPGTPSHAFVLFVSR